MSPKIAGWGDFNLGQQILGIEGVARKRMLASITKQAEEASRWIWLNRNKPWQKTSEGNLQKGLGYWVAAESSGEKWG